MESVVLLFFIRVRGRCRGDVRKQDKVRVLPRNWLAETYGRVARLRRTRDEKSRRCDVKTRERNISQGALFLTVTRKTGRRPRLFHR